MKKIISLLLFIPLISSAQNFIEKTVDEPKDEKHISFAIIDEVPIFPGCETVEKSQRRQCFQEKMNQHIAQNFRYPEFAQKNGIQGRVFIQFMIENDGNIDDIRARGPHHLLEQAAKIIIAKLPKMKPGTQKGKPVRVPFSIPITFRLN